jgi:hypothetical protein
MQGRVNRRRFLQLSAGATLATATLGSMPVHAASSTETAITIDGGGTGLTFMGIGAISGGGGTSRLLFDYPLRQQQEILDYLFKPHYGASLHILKVEIGGDTNSTNGAEASHMRSRTDQNYHRGYEWWVMEQAKLRNPAIKLYGLEWGAPGWFQLSPDIDPRHPFWSHDNVTYLINWIEHAWLVHGLRIDYIGGWNESGYNKAWYEALKQDLVSHGLTTKVVASDDIGWAVATDMVNDPAFNEAVDIIGSHYPTTRPPTPDAVSLNKPLWASENGSAQYDTGAAAIARSLNRDYVAERLVADINWSLISSWYPTLPFFGDGLMMADEPWSGNYVVGKSIWAMAHTGQFTQPGWQYIDSACGYLSGDSSNGSYVTLQAPNRHDYSVIIETTTATAAQTVQFQVTGGLSNGVVHVWSTNLGSSNASDYFVHEQDLVPRNGAYALTVQPGSIYSLTTTWGQRKGVTTPPPSAVMRLPFHEDFERYAPGHLARYFSDISGAFETAPCGGGRRGMCYRQVITTQPIAWPHGSPIAPITLCGDYRWQNYQVSTDVLLEQAGYVELIGNLTSQIRLAGAATGYHLRITDTGQWTLFREDATLTVLTDTTLASGTVPFGLNEWHRLSLSLRNGTIQAYIDHQLVATASDTTYTSGQIGLLVSKWINAQFDNILVV